MPASCYGDTSGILSGIFGLTLFTSFDKLTFNFIDF